MQIYTDGGSRGNPGSAAFGFVVKEDGQVVKKGFGKIGVATNNFAEYTAVIEAMKALKEDYNGQNLEFYMDSQLVVSQLNGSFKVKNPTIRDLVMKIRELEPSFKQITYTHVPREENKEADALVNLALDSN